MTDNNYESRINELENKLNMLQSKNNQKNEENNDFLSTKNFILVQKGMLFFFLIISGNYIGELLSCRTQKLFSQSMYSKHIIALLSLYFFVIVSDSKLQKYNPIITFFGTILIYVYFLCMAKVESKYFLYSLILLTILAFTQVYKDYLEDNKENLSDFEKNIQNKINLIQKILIGITFFVTLIGLLIYLGMKKIEYGNQFTYPLFFLGKSSCSNNLLGNLKTIKEVNVRNITRFSVDLKNVLFFVKSAFTR